MARARVRLLLGVLGGAAVTVTSALAPATLRIIPAARAADPPAYYAIALGWTRDVTGVNAINRSGMAVGITGDGELVRITDDTVEEIVDGYAMSLNDAGTIVGYANDEAIRVDGSTVTYLGTLGGWSGAYDIDEAGVTIVGASHVPSGDQHAFVHDGSTMADLGTLGGDYSIATEVNDAGLIAGVARDANGDMQVVTWSGGSIADHGNLGASYVNVVDMNEAGDVLVSAGFSGVGDRALMWDGASLVDLGTLGGPTSWAGDINEAGQIVGSSVDGSGRWRAFIVDGGPIQDLGTLGGSNSWAASINDAGQIVGWSDVTGNATQHGFLIDDGVMYDLNDLLPPGSVEVTGVERISDSGHIIANGPAGTIMLVPGERPQAAFDLIELGGSLAPTRNVVAADINSAGQAAAEVDGRAYLLDGASATPIGPLVYSSGLAINEHGHVAGFADDPATEAFLYDGAFHKLGTLGGSMSWASDLNDAGDVVGISETADGDRHAFVYRDGSMVDLGALGGFESDARLVNENGLIAGYHSPVAGVYRAFVSDGTTTTDLGVLGGGVTAPYDLNDAGQIVGISGGAYVYEDGVMTSLPLGGYASAISPNGWIAGNAPGFIYRDGISTTIPPFPGSSSFHVTDINDDVQVVGYAGVSGTTLAWIYKDGVVRDLNGLIPSGTAARLRVAVEITPDGKILVRGLNERGHDRSYLLIPTETSDPDSDGDGIWDSIEDPGVTGGFLDTSTEPDTVGRIVTMPAGLSAVVEDASDPADGVRVVVSGTGTDKVTFSVCGLTVKLAAGSDVVFTCGSLIARVIAGEAEIELAGGLTIVTIPEGGHAEVDEGLDGTISVDNLGTAPVTVVVDGATRTVAPGDTADIGAWDFQGFSAPVDMPPDLNAVKAGQSVPFRWRLVNEDGAPVTDLDAVRIRVTSLTCPLGSTADQLEETGAGASGLQNLGDGYYQYNWKTPKGYARSCKTAFLEIGGVERSALFSFTK